MLMFDRKVSVITYFLVVFVFKITSAQQNLINFGGSKDESGQVRDYMMVDNEFPNTSPTEGLKRTQRSFWKKLFKHGWFGEEDCNDGVSYNVGDGNSYNDHPLGDFQPFRPLQNWRPFQPLFGGNCQRCRYPERNYNYANDQDTVSYNNNYGMVGYGLNAGGPYGDNTNPSSQPNYPDNANTGSTYISNEDTEGYGKKDQSSYETVSKPPSGSGNVADNIVADQPYQSSPDLSANIITDSAPSQTYENKDNTDLLSMQIPQILYQPIIYVSPQYQEHARNQIKLKSESYDKTTSTTATNVESQLIQTGYETNKSQTYNGLNYNSAPQETAKCSPALSYSNAASYLPHCIQPPSTNIQMPTPCTGGPSSLPTVSAVYTVISPPKVAPPTILDGIGSDNCTPLTPMVPKKQDDGPSKYSLSPSNGITTPVYSKPWSPYKPLTTMQLTLDDQPYRVCPELFEDYNRRLNTVISCAQPNYGRSCSSGNTFINAQVISY